MIGLYLSAYRVTIAAFCSTQIFRTRIICEVEFLMMTMSINKIKTHWAYNIPENNIICTEQMISFQKLTNVE